MRIILILNPNLNTLVFPGVLIYYVRRSNILISILEMLLFSQWKIYLTVLEEKEKKEEKKTFLYACKFQGSVVSIVRLLVR